MASHYCYDYYYDYVDNYDWSWFRAKKEDRTFQCTIMTWLWLVYSKIARREKNSLKVKHTKHVNKTKLRNGKTLAASNYLCDNITENNNEECYFQNLRCTIYIRIYKFSILSLIFYNRKYATYFIIPRNWLWCLF